MPASPEQRALLVVSASARALAQSAVRGGHSVVVLDLFNDLDVRAAARASRCVASRGGRFDARRLLAAAQMLCPPQRCAGLLCGSGFEARTGLLARLAQGRTLFGNLPQTIARLKDPQRFFGLLDALRIAHPETRLDPPADPRGWLVKRIGAAGGSHVQPARARQRARAQRYFQRWQDGRTLSVLFAANGQRARVIGCNEQWTAGLAQCAPYCYGGAAGGIALPARAAMEIARLLDRLVEATGLIGLNGLDFIVDARGEPQVLEVNPRPPATFELYDADFADGLVSVHLRACAGALPPLPRRRAARAHAIVYATQALRVPAGMQWPAWCTDLPAGGSLIAAGAPVCSVHAEAGASAQAREKVLARLESVRCAIARKAA